MTSHAHTLWQQPFTSHTHTPITVIRTEANKPPQKKKRKKPTKAGRKQTLERMLAFCNKYLFLRECENLSAGDSLCSFSLLLSMLVIARIFNSLTQFECRLVVVLENSPLSVFTVIWTRAEQLSASWVVQPWLGGFWFGFWSGPGGGFGFWFLVLARHHGDR